MFRFLVDDVKKYKNATDAIVNLIDEGILEVGSEGLFLRAMDPSQIAMVVFSMPSTSFKDYEAPTPSAKVGLNFDAISKILSRSRDDEKLEISKQENKLQLKFVSKKRKRSFKVPILDMPAGPSKEPSVIHNAFVKIKGSQFKESLRDALLVGSHITLEANQNGFFIEVHGESTELTEENETESEEAIQLKVEQPARATFPLQFLEDMVRACPENQVITLSLKTDKPLKLEYDVDGAKVVYYLAPRTEAE